MSNGTSATTFQLVGAGFFGAVIGWFIYYLNRYRKEVALADLGTLLAAVGAGAVLTLFPAKTDLFAAYAIGLAGGFFLYLVVLLIFVIISPGVSVSVFLGVLPEGVTRDDIGRTMDTERELNQ